jgi:hypothetical protein
LVTLSEGAKSHGAVTDLLAAMAVENPAAASGVLGSLDPALGAAAVSGLPPNVAADLASVISDPTVTAAMLEQMPVGPGKKLL